MTAISRPLVVLSSLYAISYGLPGDSTSGASHCKAFPGSASWPSPDSWIAFNESLGGKLIQPSPPGSVCHPEQATFDSEKCANLATAWLEADYHAGDPVSTMWNQFANDTCLPDSSYPCSPAGYPAYVVNATSTGDVKAAVDFAREHEIRLSVKSTGHDFQGRSVAPGSLSIWVHHLRVPMETHASFQPQGCSFAINHTAVTASPGAQMWSVYEELDKINQTAVGGNGATVSLGGYLTGGGHSVLAPHYGLGADQVYEMEVVTPMGDVVVANECQNQDLFWALRGGGGSTFGVITSVTMATYPSPQLVSADLSILTTQVDAPYLWDLVGYLLSQFPYLASKGVSGYAYFLANTTTTITTTSAGGSNSTQPAAGMKGAFVTIDTQSTADMQAIWAPIFAHAAETWPGVLATPHIAAHPSFMDWYATHYDAGAAGTDTYVGSHLLDEAALSSTNNNNSNSATALGEAYRVFAQAGNGGTAYLVAGKGTWEAKPRGGGNAVCPSWRKTLVHAVNGVSFQPKNATAKAEALVKLNASIEPVRKLAPDMGSYMNENNPAEPDWQQSFWGENYDRLLTIKRAVDPDDVFWCHPCVGNERWEEVGYQLCRIEGGEGN